MPKPQDRSSREYQNQFGYHRYCQASVRVSIFILRASVQLVFEFFFEMAKELLEVKAYRKRSVMKQHLRGSWSQAYHPLRGVILQVLPSESWEGGELHVCGIEPFGELDQPYGEI